MDAHTLSPVEPLELEYFLNNCTLETYSSMEDEVSYNVSFNVDYKYVVHIFSINPPLYLFSKYLNTQESSLVAKYIFEFAYYLIIHDIDLSKAEVKEDLLHQTFLDLSNIILHESSLNLIILDIEVIIDAFKKIINDIFNEHVTYFNILLGWIDNPSDIINSNTYDFKILSAVEKS